MPYSYNMVCFDTVQPQTPNTDDYYRNEIGRGAVQTT